MLYNNFVGQNAHFYFMNEIIYQIYPLGFCGVIHGENGNKHNILKVLDWKDHLKKLGVTTILFNPLFESEKHGYDTISFLEVDKRLGTNSDLKKVIKELHKSGFKVMFDAVFNHVGRSFPLFQDVLKKKWDSEYKDYFYIDFSNSNNEDGFSYADWEGHHSLVKLNLQNPQVKEYLFSVTDKWIEEFAIDGIRLDVAYTIDRTFMRELVAHIKSYKDDFFFLGEMVNGDYNTLLNDACLDSVTNYECRKGLFSSFNSHNLFEIMHSLNRQFGNEPWALYTGRKLLSFLDNHDVDRIASVINDERDLPLIYSLLFTMPGIPCVYYGSEWKAKGTRTNHNDDDLRVCFKEPKWNDLCETISDLSSLRNTYQVFYDGDYSQLVIQNEALAFKRETSEEILIYLLNISENDNELPLNINLDSFMDLTNNKEVNSYLLGKSYKILYCRK